MNFCGKRETTMVLDIQFRRMKNWYLLNVAVSFLADSFDAATHEFASVRLSQGVLWTELGRHTKGQ
jgi:hypothetical protein